MNRYIYLDNASTTKPYEEVYKYLYEERDRVFGNPSSLHRLGVESEKEIKKTRQILSDFLNCRENEIIFTSGGTESNNLAIMGYLDRNKFSGSRVITSMIEHPSVKNVFERLEKQGYQVLYVPNNDEGRPSYEVLDEMVDDNTSLVSIMHVNNETGNINDIKRYGNIIKKNNPKTVFHVDGVQGFLKFPVDLKESKIDMYTLSGHKIHALKGIGALFINKNIKVMPIFSGGGQEFDIRSGTENLSGIISLGIAAEEFKNRANEIMKISDLNKKLREGIMSIEKAVIVSEPDASPFITAVSFPGIPAETMIHYMENEGIYISPGAACSSRKRERSHVLSSMNFSDDIIDSTLRISFCYENTEEEIDKTIYNLRKGTTALYKVYK